MTIKQAIEKAIEGGWRPTKYVDYQNKQQVSGLAFIHDIYIRQAAFLDPLFWQSLGKAMGWDKDKKGNDIFLKVRNFLGRTAIEMKAKSPIEFWEYKWHRFIDHLAEGKDAESYFQSL